MQLEWNEKIHLYQPERTPFENWIINFSPVNPKLYKQTIYYSTPLNESIFLNNLPHFRHLLHEGRNYRSLLKSPASLLCTTSFSNCAHSVLNGAKLKDFQMEWFRNWSELRTKGTPSRAGAAIIVEPTSSKGFERIGRSSFADGANRDNWLFVRLLAPISVYSSVNWVVCKKDLKKNCVWGFYSIVNKFVERSGYFIGTLKLF